MAIPCEPSRSAIRSRLLLLLLAEAMVAFVVLSFELTGARLVAPYAGMSTDTWTAIIAAFLAALALGNLAGGPLAARATPSGALRLAALACVTGAAAMQLVPMLLPAWAAAVLGQPPFGMMRLLLFTGLPFVFAGALLGLATPLIVAPALVGPLRVTRIIGGFYAAGAGGSLAGALATLWVLNDILGLRLSVMVLGAVLTIVAAVCLVLSRRRPRRPT